MGETNHSRYIPFNLTDKRYATALFNITLKPTTDAGISVWWLDWFDGEQFTHIPRTIATWWWGYTYWTNPYQFPAGERHVILHRWGGLGQQRYPIGFSGDVKTSWASLAFQPLFTASASNVGFVHWSHDLGSFVGQPDPELFLRWLQWGAHSPVWRTHCNKPAEITRFPWEFPWAYYRQLRRMYKLRQSLVPYVYTAARRAYDTGLGLVLPLYYEWPELNEAYTYNHTYLFGPAMFVNPVTVPIHSDTQMTPWTVWVPPGRWVNTFTGEVVSGPKVVEGNWTLGEVPAYALVGSIVPMLPDSTPPLGQSSVTPLTLKLMVYVGGALSGEGLVYDDDGVNDEYQQKQGYAFTRFDYTVTTPPDGRSHMQLAIGPASGTFTGQPSNRGYEVWIQGVAPATKVTIEGNEVGYTPYTGLSLAYTGGDLTKNSWGYDGTTLSVVVYVRSGVSVQKGGLLTVDFLGVVDDAVLTPPGGYAGGLQRWIEGKVTLDDEWGTSTQVYQDDYPHLLQMAQMGEVLTNSPMNATTVLGGWKAVSTAACSEIGRIKGLRTELRVRLEAQLCSHLGTKGQVNVEHRGEVE